MDIYACIEKDHKTARDLMKKIDHASNVLDQYSLFEKLKHEVTIHAQVEEATFYHAIHQKMPKETHHAQEEHDEITGYLNKLTEIPLSSPRWLQTFQELKKSLEHHMQEEEKEFMPKAKAILSANEAEKLGREMDHLKQKTMAEVA